MHEKTYLTKSLRLRNKRSRMVSEQRKTEERRGTGFFFNLAARKMECVFDSHPLFFAAKPQRNRSETAPLRNACYILCRLKVSKGFCTPFTITITVIINIIIIIEFRIKKNQSLQIAKISFSQNRPSARWNSPQTLLSVIHTAGFTLQNRRYFFEFSIRAKASARRAWSAKHVRWGEGAES